MPLWKISKSQKREAREEERNKETTEHPENNKMALVSPRLSVIILNVSGFIFQSKGIEQLNGFLKKPNYMVASPSEISLGGMVLAAYRQDFIKLHVGIGSLICYEKDAIMKLSFEYTEGMLQVFITFSPCKNQWGNFSQPSGPGKPEVFFFT